jgi:hypothetical protein
MKRLLVLLAAVVAVVAVQASTAASASQQPKWTMSLASPGAPIVGDLMTVHGTVTVNWNPMGAHTFVPPKSVDVVLSVYSGAMCITTVSATEVVQMHSFNQPLTSRGLGFAKYAFQHDLDAGLAPGVYSLQADTRSQGQPGGAVSGCASFTISAVPQSLAAPSEPGIFLCYSAWQIDPAVYPLAQATQLMAEGGYWTPFAVPGTVTGGTNLGDHHLVCNLATGQAASLNLVGADGRVVGPALHDALAGILGWYPAIG